MRWYQRASRERRPRETVVAAVVDILGELRSLATARELLGHYCGHDGDWALTIITRRGCGEAPSDLRQVEDAAYGTVKLSLLGTVGGPKVGSDRRIGGQIRLLRALATARTGSVWGGFVQSKLNVTVPRRGPVGGARRGQRGLRHRRLAPVPPHQSGDRGAHPGLHGAAARHADRQPVQGQPRCQRPGGADRDAAGLRAAARLHHPGEVRRSYRPSIAGTGADNDRG